MFKLLKKSLGGIVRRFTNEIKEEVQKGPIAQEPKPKGLGKRITEKFTKTTISEEKFEQLFWEMELGMLQNNLASKVVERIKEGLKEELVGKPIPRKGIHSTIANALEKSLKAVLSFEVPDFMELVKSKKPFIILFVGVNGSGKTTTIAKICKMLLDNRLRCVMVAADTFRAAAIDQLEEHANALGVKIIKHDYGADPAAVAFDGVDYAKAHNVDVVLIDTAGRLHTNQNLLDELKKIKRVAKPDIVLYVGESITGNDCIEQAAKYNNEIGIDGIVLTKVDIDERGGTPLSIAYVTQKPIWFIGTGQGYKNIQRFNQEEIIKKLGLSQ